jgi:hypothetical protein
MTLRRIKETTDNKYIGITFDDAEPFITPDGITFQPTKIQNLGDGYVRYSNSNYVILTKEIK